MENKYKYSTKLLTDHLSRELEELSYWSSRIESSEDLTRRQATTNLGTCKKRIEELESVIKIIKTL